MKAIIYRWDEHNRYVEAEEIEAPAFSVRQNDPYSSEPMGGEAYIHIRGRARSLNFRMDTVQIFLAATTPYRVIRHASDFVPVAKVGAA